MRLVCVTGMHRSGTSLVARMLNLLGVELGAEEELLGAAPDNPKGFWEHREVKGFNDRVLAKLGGRWDEPPPLPPGWENLPDLNPARKDAAAFVAGQPDGEVIGWKDPRLSLTLPFWRTVTAVDQTVLCLRDPEEVAGSLAVRNGLPAERAADLWVRYTLAAWVNDPRRIVVNYPDALEDPEGTSERLVRLLDLPEPDEGALEEIREFVDADLRHHEETPLDGPTMRLARTLYSILSNRQDQKLDPLLYQLHQGWHGTERLAELSSRLDELLDERERLEDEHQALKDQLEDERQALKDAIQRRDRSIRSAQVQREMLQARVARLNVEVEDLGRSLIETEEELSAAGDRAAQAERDVAKLEAANQDLEQLRESNRRFKERMKELEREHRKNERRYDRLRNRRSVRLSLAIAELFRPLFRLVRRIRSRSSQPADRGSSEGRSDDRPSGGTAAPTSLSTDDEHTTVGEGTLTALSDLGQVTVIVPVHDALEHVRRCVDSLVRNTTRPAELLIIDDASTDPEVAPYLEQVATRPNIRVLRNDTNLGFSASVNRGFDESSGDVVVLNSDTEVTPRWLERLTTAAYRWPDIGTVTAISDNAGAFSMPDIGVANRVPPHLAKDQIGILVAQRSARIAPETPTGNGFCMYVKRDLLDDVGGFDADAFPRGYGEENDLCMRALDAGYRHVVDDTTYVFHAREASFGSEKKQLAEAGREVLDRRFPDYTERVRAFVRSPELRAAQQRVRETFRDAPHNVRRRVLYVIHAGMGGAPQTNEDLVASLDPRYECFVLTSDTKRLVLYRYDEGDLEETKRLELEEPIELGQFSRPDYRRFIAHVLVEYAIDLVHIRHLIKHTFDVPAVAAALSIPVIVSFHDFYLSCPTVHLLDNEDRFCAGRCTPGQGRCRLPNEWLAQAPEPLKHGWVHTWRDHVRPILQEADALVTTTSSARETYLHSFPSLRDHRFEVIEHGRDIQQRDSRTPAPEPGGPVRILVPGNLDVHKGAHFVRALQELDREGRLEFHLLGRVEPRFRGLGTYHGTYDRKDFADRAAEIAPAFVGLFSVCGETYSHTLTEAWACGLPVIASNLGALGERVRRHGRGWVINVGNPESAYERILAIADDPEEYWRIRRQVTARDLPTVADMAHRYDRLYRSVLRGRRCFVHPPGATQAPSEPLDMSLFVVRGSDPGTYPGSVHVRTLRRYQHPNLELEVTARVADVDGFLTRRSPDPHVLHVQRNAIDPSSVDDVIAACGERDVPLVVDLDDNLLDLHQLPTDDNQWREAAPSLQRLVAAADLVTVSTGPLRDAVKRYAEDVIVVPNHLDGTLWLDRLEDRPVQSDGVRVLYMGTPTHEEDLALLRSVITRFDVELNIPLKLEIIGGERPGYGQDWYTRVPVPSGTSHYPRFVRWLRSEAGRWDMAVAPLAGTEFNQYKSDLKFLEYSALGLPGVYSAVPAYASSVRDGSTGLLVENTTERWFEAVRGLATDWVLRSRIRQEAWSYVAEERTLERHADHLMDILRATARREELHNAAA